MTTDMLLRAPRRPAPGGVSSGATKRRDIQGLRATAVLLVVLDHLTNTPAGGFTGVDVFFVVSGYLISGLLIRDLADTRTLGSLLTTFYRRRVRRLMPAALVVLVAVALVAPSFVAEGRAHASRVDGWWAAFFLVNWHLIGSGTDYFASTQPPSLVQHYWSLSVEEQFYLVWPIALFATRAAAGVVGRLSGRDVRRAALTLLIAVSFVASFLYSLELTSTATTQAYFSSPARAWELCLGAALALVTWRPQAVMATVLPWLGIGAIFVSAFVVHEGQAFPAPAGLLPCVGAGLVILGGRGSVPVRNVVLTNRAVVWVGDVSYSVYLVHWPVIQLLLARFSTRGLYFYASTVAAILGFSCTLYYVVERPFMNSRLLLPRSRSAGIQRPAPWRAGGAERAVSAVTALSLAFLAVGVYTLWPGKQQQQESLYQKIVAALAERPAVSASSGPGPRELALQTQLRTALGARTWPALVPTMSAETQRGDVPSDILSCGLIVLQPAARCTYGPSAATHTLYVVGDSTAMSYVEAYRKMLDHMPDWNLRVAAAFGCSFSSIVTKNVNPDVDERLRPAQRERGSGHPAEPAAALLITNAYTAGVSTTTGEVINDEEWTRGVSEEIASTGLTAGVAIVEPAAVGPDPSRCDVPGGAPADCVFHLPAAHLDRSAAARVMAGSRGWTYVGSEGWMCDLATLQCPAFVGGVPIKHDEIHIGYAFADLVWPVMAEGLQRAGVLPVALPAVGTSTS